MVEAEWCGLPEAGKFYRMGVVDYVLNRSTAIEHVLFEEANKGEALLGVAEMVSFAAAIVRAVPVCYTERLAPHVKKYYSLRGAGYGVMSLGLRGKEFFSKGGREAIMLGHEFRASANALDAAEDVKIEDVDRRTLRESPNAVGFRESKKAYFELLRALARTGENRDCLNGIGTSARRYQMHQDLYADLSIMKRKGIGATQFLRVISEVHPDFWMSKELLAFLTVMGMDGETLLVDSSISVGRGSMPESGIRKAAFWGAVMGALGDHWADILQDTCSKSPNLFWVYCDRKYKSSEIGRGIIVDEMNKGRKLLGGSDFLSKLQFLQLQISAARKLQQKLPSEVDGYASMIKKAYLEIPDQHRLTLVPIRFGSWELSPLYQLSDFLLHFDGYESGGVLGETEASPLIRRTA